MLILTRKNGEKLIINDNIEIIIVESENNNVKIGINAPKNISIYREELYKEIKKANQISAQVSSNALNELKSAIMPEAKFELKSTPKIKISKTKINEK